MSRRRRKRQNATQPKIARDSSRRIPADPSQQAPNNSWSPPEYYEDITYTCCDCGAEQVWTAEQQKWYYEVAKGPIYATAVRCLACRRRRSSGRGDPNPIKHIGTLLRRVRSQVESCLVEAGFTYEGRRELSDPPHSSFSYARPAMILHFVYDRWNGQLTAESMDAELQSRLVATMKLPEQRSQWLQAIDDFGSAVREYIHFVRCSNEEGKNC